MMTSKPNTAMIRLSDDSIVVTDQLPMTARQLEVAMPVMQQTMEGWISSTSRSALTPIQLDDNAFMIQQHITHFQGKAVWGRVLGHNGIIEKHEYVIHGIEVRDNPLQEKGPLPLPRVLEPSDA